MPIERSQVIEVVDAFLEQWPGDAERLAPFRDAISGGGELISRSALPGHVTCSAYVFNDRDEILHVRHRFLGRWLQPGGHCEPSDASPMDGARREAAEETGIPVIALRALAADAVDVDAHWIPASPAKGEPAHWHFDLRYAFEVDSAVALAPQAEEVSEVRWFALDDPEAVTAEPSMLARSMATRLRALRATDPR